MFPLAPEENIEEGEECGDQHIAPAEDDRWQILFDQQSAVGKMADDPGFVAQAAQARGGEDPHGNDIGPLFPERGWQRIEPGLLDIDLDLTAQLAAFADWFAVEEDCVRRADAAKIERQAGRRRAFEDDPAAIENAQTLRRRAQLESGKVGWHRRQSPAAVIGEIAGQIGGELLPTGLRLDPPLARQREVPLRWIPAQLRAARQKLGRQEQGRK